MWISYWTFLCVCLWVSEDEVENRNLTLTTQTNMPGSTWFHFFSALLAAVRSIHNLAMIRAHAWNNALLLSFHSPFTNRYLINNDLNCTQQELVFCYSVLLMLTGIKKLKPNNLIWLILLQPHDLPTEVLFFLSFPDSPFL